LFQFVSAYSLSQNTIKSAETSQLFHQSNQSETLAPDHTGMQNLFSEPMTWEGARRAMSGGQQERAFSAGTPRKTQTGTYSHLLRSSQRTGSAGEKAGWFRQIQ
jgi:hypothetical protein